MADAMVEEPTTTRSGRVITPSTRVREASGSDIISAVRTSKKSMTQVELTAVKKAAGLIEEKQSGKDGSRDMLKKIGQYLASTYQEVKGLKEIIIEQGKMIKEQSEMIRAQSSTIQALQTQVEAIESQSIEECKQLWEQLNTIDTEFAPLARPTLANTLFCTIDTSRVGEEDKARTQIASIRQQIEREMGGNRKHKTGVVQQWLRTQKCRPDKVICRHEEEIQQVKEAAQKIDIPGIRVLRDQLYPVKIDNANRTAVLDADGNILLRAAEVLGKENKVKETRYSKA
uniref:Uncharacterized protein n=1 Tax=Talaromyces marneffei PM1 TaxID=1077442 RepID=A0A093UYX5_TALMA